MDKVNNQGKEMPDIHLAGLHRRGRQGRVGRGRGPRVGRPLLLPPRLLGTHVGHDRRKGNQVCKFELHCTNIVLNVLSHTLWTLTRKERRKLNKIL